MAKKISIAGELESKTTEGKLADASQIKDSSRENKSQKEINDEFQNEIQENSTDIQRLYRATGIDEYSEFSTLTDYVIGNVVLFDGVLFRFKADHAAGEWDYNEVEEWSEKKEREERVEELCLKNGLILFNIGSIDYQTGEGVVSANRAVTQYLDINDLYSIHLTNGHQCIVYFYDKQFNWIESETIWETSNVDYETLHKGNYYVRVVVKASSDDVFSIDDVSKNVFFVKPSQKAYENNNNILSVGLKSKLILLELGNINYNNGIEEDSNTRARTSYLDVWDIDSIHLTNGHQCIVYFYDKQFNWIESETIWQNNKVTFEMIHKGDYYIRIVVMSSNDDDFSLSNAIDNLHFIKPTSERSKQWKTIDNIENKLYSKEYVEETSKKVLGVINSTNGEFKDLGNSAVYSGLVEVQGGLQFSYRTPSDNSFAGYCLYDKDGLFISSHRGNTSGLTEVQIAKEDAYYAAWQLEGYEEGVFTYTRKSSEIDILKKENTTSVPSSTISELGILNYTNGEVNTSVSQRQNSGLIEVGNGVSFSYYTPSDPTFAGYCLYDKDGLFISSHRGVSNTTSFVSINKGEAYYVRWTWTTFEETTIEYTKIGSVKEFAIYLNEKISKTPNRFGGKNIYFLGSSSTENLDIYEYKAYPYWLGYWNNAISHNLGKSGATLVYRTDSSNYIYNKASLVDSDADYILIMIGANDVYQEGITFEDNGEMTDFVSAYKYLLEELTKKCPLATIGLIIPYQAGGMTTGVSATNYTRMKESVVGIAKMFALQVIDVGECGFNGLFVNNDVTVYSQEAIQARKNAMATDHAHLNAVGQEKMARVIDGFLHKL